MLNLLHNAQFTYYSQVNNNHQKNKVVFNIYLVTVVCNNVIGVLRCSVSYLTNVLSFTLIGNRAQYVS